MYIISVLPYLYPLYVLVMYDNDFTTILIIIVFMSRYDNYHDSNLNDKMQNLILIYLSYMNNVILK